MRSIAVGRPEATSVGARNGGSAVRATNRTPEPTISAVKAPRPAPPFLYRTFTVDVRPRALADVMRGLEAVAAHARCEPGTRLCAWFQSTVQPTRLLHVLVVDDEAAERVHRSSGPARQLAFMLERGATHAGSVTEWTVLAGI